MYDELSAAYFPHTIILPHSHHTSLTSPHFVLFVGYTGVFSPKPHSACLEVSDLSDGCAVFVKADRLRIVSNEVSEMIRGVLSFYHNLSNVV